MSSFQDSMAKHGWTEDDLLDVCASDEDTRDEVTYPAWMERDPSTGEVP